MVRLRKLGRQPTTLAPSNRHSLRGVCLRAIERWFQIWGHLRSRAPGRSGGACTLYSNFGRRSLVLSKGSELFAKSIP